MKIGWLRSLTESRVHVGHYLVVVLRLILPTLVLTIRMRLAGRMSSTLLLMLWLVWLMLWLMLWLVLWLALILLVSFINVCLVLMLDRVWRVLLLLIKVF